MIKQKLVRCRRCGVQKELRSNIMARVGAAHYCATCLAKYLESRDKRARLQAARGQVDAKPDPIVWRSRFPVLVSACGRWTISRDLNRFQLWDSTWPKEEGCRLFDSFAKAERAAALANGEQP